MTAGKVSKNGNGSSPPGPVPGAEPVGCVPERLHLFPREEGCRGRRGEAAIVTPDLSSQCMYIQDGNIGLVV